MYFIKSFICGMSCYLFYASFICIMYMYIVSSYVCDVLKFLHAIPMIFHAMSISIYMLHDN